MPRTSAALSAVVPLLLTCCQGLLDYDGVTFETAASGTGQGGADAATLDAAGGTAGAAGKAAGGSGSAPEAGTGGTGGASGAAGGAGAAGSGGTPSPCPNEACDQGEICSSCPADCGACCPNGTCDNAENSSTCPQDCPVACNPVPVACGKLGAQTLDATLEFVQFLGACPRVAKWVSGGGYADFDGMQAYRCACSGGATILRLWGPAASYPTGDDLWNARYGFLAGATAQQKASVDYLESDNECDAGHCFENAADYNTFLLQFVARAKAEGFKPLIGNIAVGNPGGDVETCTGDGMQKFGAIVPAIVAAGQAGGGWGYHSYTSSWEQSTTGMMSYLPFRYRRYLGCFPQLANVPLIFTEAGFDKGGNPDADGWSANGSAQTYLQWLGWYQAQLNNDASVLGAALFTFAPSGNWHSFRLDPIVGELSQLVKACP